MADITAPTLINLSPVDGATAVPLDANIVLTFDEAVRPGVSPGFGTITIETPDGITLENIDINDTSQVSFSGAVVTINPNVNLVGGTEYAVIIDRGVITDLAGNSFAGFLTLNSYNFTSGYSVPPTLLYTSPVADSHTVPIDPRFVFSFNQAMQAGAGSIQIHNASDGSVFESISAGDTGQVRYTDNLVIVEPTSVLNPGANYFVTIDNGALRDTSGIAFPGTSGPAGLAFTTAPDAIDRTEPVLSSTNPLNGADNVPFSEPRIVFTFDEPVKAGSGSIHFGDGLQQLDFNISVSDASKVTFSGNTMSIAGPLEAGQVMIIDLPFGVVQDLAGNAFDGSSLQFSTTPSDYWVFADYSSNFHPPYGVTLKAGDLPVNMAAWDPAQIAGGQISLLSGKEVDIVGAANSGTGATYHLKGDFPINSGFPSGTIDELDVAGTADGVQNFQYSITDIMPTNPFDIAEPSSAFMSLANQGRDQFEQAIFSSSDKLFGSPRADVLLGYGGDDTIAGGAGNDSLDGGTGTDTAVYTGARSDYGISLIGSTYTIADTRAGSPDGVDQVMGVENFQFSDGTLTAGHLFDPFLAPPSDSNPAPNSVAEGAANGTPVGITAASVDSAGRPFTFSLSYDAEGRFAIDPSTGIVTVANAALIDYETATSQFIVIQVSDGTLTKTQSFIISVTNVPGVTITGTSAGDIIDATHTVAGNPFPSSEEDTINGGGGNDIINALGGNDFINGGTGADTMIGGAGNDTYIVDNTGDVVVENPNEGNDAVQSSISYTLGANLEDLLLLGVKAISGTGNGMHNVITGNGGANTLAGLGGPDDLDGGAGVDKASYATSPAAVDVSLATGQGSGGDAEGDTLTNIENLVGSNFADTLEGNAGNNNLNGGGGSDTVSYLHAHAGVTVNLAITSAQNTVAAGTDTLASFANVTGSYFDDILTGSNAANLINGGFGNDTIDGGAGSDTLIGGAGNDILTGGTGKDTLTGGADGDVFVFGPANSTNADTITDFEHGLDVLQFSAIDYGLPAGPLNPAYLVFGTAANDHHAEFIYSAATETLRWDPDGVGGLSAATVATFTSPVTLTASDLIVA